MKDEIAHEIATELRLIREELQKLTGAIKSSTNRSGNSYTGNSRKSYQARAPLPPESGQPGGLKLSILGILKRKSGHVIMYRDVPRGSTAM